MQQLSTIEKLVQQYKKSPVLRGLIQLIPFGIGSGVDAALLTTIQNIRKERARAFFDELATGKIELKPELLKSEDFLHCYFATVKAALKTRRQEKIRMFARLLRSYPLPNSFADTDEYEEYLGMLDELPYREFLILSILDKYESQFKKAEEDDFKRANLFWKQFTSELEQNMDIPENEVDPILIRLTRTGCYEIFVGYAFGPPGGQGRLTPTYFRLKKLIESEEGKLA